MTLRIYNHKKGLPDARDFKFHTPLLLLATKTGKQALPTSLDFRTLYPKLMPFVFKPKKSNYK